MRLFLLLSFVSYVLAEDLLYLSGGGNLVKSPPYEGRVFKHAHTVKTDSPYQIAVYIEGNGVKGEATTTVNDPREVNDLRISDHVHTVVARLPRRKFGVMCQEDEPGIMYVLQDSKCTKRKYSAADPSKLEKPDSMDETACEKLKRMMRQLDFHESAYEEEEVRRQAVKDYRAQMLYYKPPNPKLHKWELWYGGLYYFGNTLDEATTPPTLGIYIRGNGVEDELYVRIESADDFKKLRVINGPKMLTVNVLEKDYRIICKIDKPGLVVIKKGKCTRRTYDTVNQAAKPKEDHFEGAECQNLIKEVDTAKILIRSEIWWDDRDYNLPKLDPYWGGTYVTSTVFNDQLNPPVLGMFIKGNGVEDEIHVKVADAYEANHVFTLNELDRVIFYLPSRDLSVIAKANSYGLVVIEKGECKRRIYDEDNPRLRPTEEVVLSEQCKEYIGEVKARFLTLPDIWYLRYRAEKREGKFLYRKFTGPDEHGFSIKWIWNYVEKKPGMEFTVAYYVKSEALEDEIRIDSKSEADARDVSSETVGDYFIFKNKALKFGLLAKGDMPYKLIVVLKGVCTRRIYRDENKKLHNEAEIPSTRCEETKKFMGL